MLTDKEVEVLTRVAAYETDLVSVEQLELMTWANTSLIEVMMAAEIARRRLAEHEESTTDKERLRFENTLVWIVSNSKEPDVIRAAAKALLGGEVQP